MPAPRSAFAHWRSALADRGQQIVAALPTWMLGWWRLVLRTDALTRAAAVAFFAVLSFPSMVIAAVALFSWSDATFGASLVADTLHALQRAGSVDLSGIGSTAQLDQLQEAARSAGPWAFAVALVAGSRGLRVLQETWSRPLLAEDTPEPLGFWVRRGAASLTLLLLLLALGLFRAFGQVLLEVSKEVSDVLDAVVVDGSGALERWAATGLDAVLLFAAFLVVVQLGSKGRVRLKAMLAGGAAWLLSLITATSVWRAYLVGRMSTGGIEGGLSGLAGGLLWLYIVCLAATFSLLVSRAVHEDAGGSSPSAEPGVQPGR